MHDVLENHPDRLVVIELHQDDTPSCPASIARAAFYGTVNTPTLIFDGEVRPEMTGFEALFLNYMNRPMPLKIGIYVVKNGNNFNLKATVTRDGNMPTDNLKIYCGVTETIQYDGRTLYNVLRDMYPISGKDFTINDGEVKTVDFNGTLDASWNINNLEWAVWVQRTVSGDPDLQPVYGANKAAGNEVVVEPSSLGKVKALFN